MTTINILPLPKFLPTIIIIVVVVIVVGTLNINPTLLANFKYTMQYCQLYALRVIVDLKTYSSGVNSNFVPFDHRLPSPPALRPLATTIPLSAAMSLTILDSTPEAGF